MQVETCNCFKLVFKSVLNIILLSAHKAKKSMFPASDWPYTKSPTLKYLFYQEKKNLKFSMPVFRVFVLPICLFSVTDQYVGVCPPTAIKI